MHSRLGALLFHAEKRACLTPGRNFGIEQARYIFIGIEEVGKQAEQPFAILPMTQLCNVIMFNLEESFAAPPREDA